MSLGNGEAPNSFFSIHLHDTDDDGKWSVHAVEKTGRGRIRGEGRCD